jgi:hypothetical protein
MKLLGPSSEREMVAEFLRAELDSRRYRHHIAPRLAVIGRTEDLLRVPDLADAGDNALRATLLDQVRGYLRREMLFKGFPVDVSWHHATLDASDLASLKCGNWPDWAAMAGGTRLIRDAASGLSPEVLPHVRGVEARIARGEPLAPIISVGESLETRELVLLEGHVRATAWLLSGGRATEALVGVSPRIGRWIAY